MKRGPTQEECRIELKKAGLKPVDINGYPSAVLHNWVFTRINYYWSAVCTEGGLPVDVATEMHFKEYPDHMFDHHKGFLIYGNSVRVEGHAGCPEPKEWDMGDGLIKSYHIDSQEGLNEFVRVIKEQNKK